MAWRTPDEFRHSRRWREFVDALKLERTGPDGTIACARCGLPIVRKYDCVGHHVTELTDENVNDAAVALNPDNVELVHVRCHNEIHDRWQGGSPYAKAGREVYLVWGSPCSGKTSFVLESAGPKDLVVDMDRLFDAVSTGGMYVKPGELLPSAVCARDALLDHIATRAGKWRRAWVIGGYPLLMERRRAAARLGAECVFVECDRATCEARAAERPEGWADAIDRWWRMFQPDPPPGEGAAGP